MQTPIQNNAVNTKGGSRWLRRERLRRRRVFKELGIIVLAVLAMNGCIKHAAEKAEPEKPELKLKLLPVEMNLVDGKWVVCIKVEIQ